MKTVQFGSSMCLPYRKTCAWAICCLQMHSPPPLCKVRVRGADSH